MKKYFAVLVMTGLLIACSGGGTKESSAMGDGTATGSAATDAASPTTAAPVKDSLMQFKDGKVMISVGGVWTALSAPVTTSNGRMVSPNGDVSKGGKTRKMEDGMVIDKDGQLMDKDGKMIDKTGWE